MEFCNVARIFKLKKLRNNYLKTIKMRAQFCGKFFKILGVKEDGPVNFNEIKNQISAFQAFEIEIGEVDELF